MRGRTNDGRKSGGPFNWLQWLDDKAPTLRKAKSWLEPYGLFMLTRYARLRPQPRPDDTRSKQMCELGEVSASRILEQWESKIANNKEAAACLQGLKCEQRRQLSALLIDTCVSLEEFKTDAKGRLLRAALAGDVRRRTRVLDRKLAAARQATQELYDYALDSKAPNGTLHDAREMLGHAYASAASHALAALQVRGGTARVDFYESAKNEYSTASRAEVFGMVRLYWLFRHECGLTGDESEVRVAILRNAFWTEVGISTVPYRETYRDAESRGCEAVHVAVTRYCP